MHTLLSCIFTIKPPLERVKGRYFLESEGVTLLYNYYDGDFVGLFVY